MTRLCAIEALEALGDPVAVAALERIALREPIPWVRGHADRAALRIRSSLPHLQRLDESLVELQSLRSDYERLRQRVGDIER